MAVRGYARAVSSLVLGNAAFSLLGRSEEWTWTEETSWCRGGLAAVFT